MDLEYSIRRAVVEDAAAMARHRARMFRDMGACTEEEAEALGAVSTAWFAGILGDGSYAGWVTVEEGRVVGGAGVHLREMGPVPGMLRVGRWGHIANVYVEPAHRGRGLARGMMRAILAWAEVEGIDRMTLAASDDGVALYRSLGFKATKEMELLRATG